MRRKSFRMIKILFKFLRRKTDVDAQQLISKKALRKILKLLFYFKEIPTIKREFLKIKKQLQRAYLNQNLNLEVYGNINYLFVILTFDGTIIM